MFNIYEWTWGWYGRYSSGSQTDPTGVTGYSYRVLRGGYYYDGWYVRGSHVVTGLVTNAVTGPVTRIRDVCMNSTALRTINP